jgi:4-hydroxythreonine-4-phosphate dehydrogenase
LGSEMQSISTARSRNFGLPKIAITMGDPAGIGPEICVRALFEPTTTSKCVPLVFGDHAVLSEVAQRLHFSLPPSFVDLTTWQTGPDRYDTPTIVDLGLIDPSRFEIGKVSQECGRASLGYLQAAINAALLNQVDAIATGPIHKESIHLAGSPHIGHTELLAEATASPRYLMMLTAPEITCSLVTAHVGLEAAAKLLTKEKIVSAMELTIEAMHKLRGAIPRLTVCGLNPHAGEGGLLGNGEEELIILPAIEAMRSRGFEIAGPLPPDTAFLPARRKQTDAYICMYHDQGLIPLKMLAFEEAINITLGLPIIRTSVDHGTAFDIAWQGVASPNSMFEAIKMAAKLASAKQPIS